MTHLVHEFAVHKLRIRKLAYAQVAQLPGGNDDVVSEFYL